MKHEIIVVVEDGVLRPEKPLAYPDGTRLRLQVTPVPKEIEPEEKARRFKEALKAWNEEAEKLSPEWWDEFDQAINASRAHYREQK